MKRNPPLVSEYLENIGREALEDHQELIGRMVHRREGVYALYRKNRLYYVGLARDLKRRMGQHLRDRHQTSWDRFSVYLTVGGRHLQELEALLLRIVSPGGNRVKGRLGRGENLAPVLKRSIENKRRKEVRVIFGWPEPEIQISTPPVREGRAPILARYLGGRPGILEARFKGKRIVARVRRDGTIRFGGSIFTSPSLAAASACNRKACNGWNFWYIERTKGNWVKLDELRR